jgi:hypothetical protein
MKDLKLVKLKLMSKKREAEMQRASSREQADHRRNVPLTSPLTLFADVRLRPFQGSQCCFLAFNIFDRVGE